MLEIILTMLAFHFFQIFGAISCAILFSVFVAAQGNQTVNWNQKIASITGYQMKERPAFIFVASILFLLFTFGDYGVVMTAVLILGYRCLWMVDKIYV